MLINFFHNEITQLTCLLLDPLFIIALSKEENWKNHVFSIKFFS
jgi:hypothetical protein